MIVNDCEPLRDAFSRAVLAHHESTLAGDSKEANRKAAALHRSASALKTHGEVGVAALEGLLAHPEAAVRCMSAAYVLKERTGAAVAILGHLAKRSDVVGLGAIETLKRWKRGDLEIR